MSTCGEMLRKLGQCLGLVDLDIPGIDRDGRLVPPCVTARTLVLSVETETRVQVELSVEGRGHALIDCDGQCAELFAEQAAALLEPMVAPFVPDVVGSDVVVRDLANKVVADTPVGLYASRPEVSMVVDARGYARLRAAWCGLELELEEPNLNDGEVLARRMVRAGIVRSAYVESTTARRLALVTHSGELVQLVMPPDDYWWGSAFRDPAQRCRVRPLL